MTLSSFAGEEFLVEHPPDFGAEWRWIVIKLCATVAFFVVAVPILLPIFFGTAPPAAAEKASSSDSEGGARANGGAKRHRDKRRKPQAESQTNGAMKHGDKANSRAGDADQRTESETATIIVVPPLLVLGMNLSCILICFLIIFNSPNNRDVARSVFLAPFLSEEECDHVIYMAHRAAERNLEEALKEKEEKEGFLASTNITADEEEDGGTKGRTLLDEPLGWRKDRHDRYPTVDLNVVTDPFTKEDRKFIEERLNSRVSPLIERVYGIAPGAIRATDMFVVRYDFENGQTALRGHTDSAHVSFNVLLNNDFTGGGTRFHNRKSKSYADAKPSRGEVLINNAMVYHEGLPVTSGTRYILVGFLSVDRKDPITSEPTGLSLFASWLSLPWAQVKFTEGLYASAERLEHGVDQGAGIGSRKWTDNKYARSLLADLKMALTFIGDIWAPHKLTKLVESETASDYIAALDSAHAKRKQKGDRSRFATWFKNQQLVVDIDGTVATEWKVRRQFEDKFKDL